MIPNKRCEFARHVTAATATSAVTVLERLPLRCPAKALVSSSQPLPSLPCSPRIDTTPWNEYVARIFQKSSSPTPRTTQEMVACFLIHTYTTSCEPCAKTATTQQSCNRHDTKQRELRQSSAQGPSSSATQGGGSTFEVIFFARCTLPSLQTAAEVRARVASGHMVCKT